MSTIIIKAGTTDIQGSTVKGGFSYYSGDTTHNLGPSSLTGFYSGVNAPYDGFAIYQIGGLQGVTVRIANNTAELNVILKDAGATGSTVDQNITWATNTGSMYINSGITSIPFIMTLVASANYNMTMPYYNGFTYNGTIDWGDGTTSANAYNANHTYSTAGTYTVTINGAIGKFNTFYSSYGSISSYIYSITQFGNQFSFGSDIGGYFGNCLILRSVASDIPLNGITNMSYMFNSTSYFNQDISSWNVSNVTNMAYMFNSSGVFNQNIGSWNVSNVTNMAYMFNGTTAFNQNIGSWNVSKVTNMAHMFTGSQNFNQPIGSWNVSNVTNMDFMFGYCYNFNQNIGSWNVSKVTNFNGILYGATGFSSVNLDNIYNGWSTLPLQYNQNFYAECCYDSSASSGRSILINNYGWGCYDGGQC